MFKKFLNSLIHIVNITLIVITFLIAIITIFREDLIKDFIERMEYIIEGLGARNYLIAFFSSTAESLPIIGMVLPGQTILLLVGGFFGNDAILEIIIVACIGAVLGNYIGFILGYLTGDSFFRNYGERFGIGLTELDYIKKGIHKYGPVAVVFSKFHPMTRAFIPFIAGSMGMKQLSFIIYNVIGSIIRAITIIILGVLFANYYELIIDYLPLIILIILIGVGIYVYFYKNESFKEYMRQKEEEIKQKEGKK